MYVAGIYPPHISLFRVFGQMANSLEDAIRTYRRQLVLAFATKLYVISQGCQLALLGGRQTSRILFIISVAYNPSASFGASHTVVGLAIVTLGFGEQLLGLKKSRCGKNVCRAAENLFIARVLV